MGWDKTTLCKTYTEIYIFYIIIFYGERNKVTKRVGHQSDW